MGTLTKSSNNEIKEQLFVVLDAIKKNVPKIGDRQPKIGTEDYQWEYCKEWDWVSGFWAGQLWLGYKVTANPIFKEAGKLQRNYFKNTLDLRLKHNHDLGFVFSLSCVAEYKLTGNEQARNLAISAADSLLGRYRRVGGYFVAWNEDTPAAPDNVAGKVIIDSFQNMPFLLWASEETGNPVYRECAINHTNTLIENIIRDDYTVHHTFNFDPVTQLPLGGENYQGYSDESCWSRGIAWALHGLAQIYTYSKDEHHLETAKKLAQYAMEQLKNNPIPLWDYKLPKDEPQHIDTSAASCTAAGLLLIASLCKSETEAQEYKDVAYSILAELINTYDLTSNQNALGLLKCGAAFPGFGKSNNMLPYGDYYYVEALMRANGYESFAW